MIRTGIPSFLITLGTFFILQGANLGVTKLVTGTVTTPNISQMDGYSSLQAIFSSSLQDRPGNGVDHRPVVDPFRHCRGLDPAADQDRQLDLCGRGQRRTALARSACRSGKSKIGLFMTVAFLAWFIGMHTLYRFNSVQAGNGVGNEFLYIIAAVVGGTLLTGGFGNAIGVAIGAFIFGMTSLASSTPVGTRTGSRHSSASCCCWR